MRSPEDLTAQLVIITHCFNMLNFIMTTSCLLLVHTCDSPKICIIACCYPGDIHASFHFSYSLFFFFNCHHLVLIKGPSGYPHCIHPTPSPKRWKVTQFYTWEVSSFQKEQWLDSEEENCFRWDVSSLWTEM